MSPARKSTFMSLIGYVLPAISVAGAVGSSYLGGTYASKDALLTTDRKVLVVEERLKSATSRQDYADKRVEEVQNTLGSMDRKIDEIRNYLLTQKGR